MSILGNWGKGGEISGLFSHTGQKARRCFVKRSVKLIFGMLCSPSALGPKRGPRQIAPKKTTLIKQQKLTKVFIYLLEGFFGGGV